MTTLSASRLHLVEKKAPVLLKGPRGDVENFHLSRWLLANQQARQTGRPAWRQAPFEAKWYAKAGRESVGQDGGYLAPEEWRAEYYRVLRGGLILNKLLADENILTTKYRVSHINWGTGDWTWNFLGENAGATSADRTTSQQTFTFRKAVAFSTIPRELIQDAPDLADQWLQQDAKSSAAHVIDRKALFGSGNGGEPVGLINQSFVNQLTLFNDSGNGATPIYNDITNGIAQIAFLGNTTLISGGAGECSGVVAAPRFGQTLDDIQSPAGIPVWQNGLSNDIDMPNQPRWLGVRNWVLSALVPTNLTVGTNSDCSYLVFGDWRYFLLMLREDFDFATTDEPNMQSNQVLVRVTIRFDAQAIFPFAFAVYPGVRQ